MANTFVSKSVPFGAHTFTQVTSKLAAIKSAIVTWNAERMTKVALANLSDTQMNDIGLSRGDLHKMPLEMGKY